MKSSFFFFFAFLLTTLSAQPGPDGKPYPGRERVEQAKIAFITRKLDLSPEQGQRFWPLYNELEKKLQPLRDKRLQLMLPAQDSGSTPSDDRIRARVMAELDLRERQAQLRKQYFSLFEEALGTQKAAQYYRAEIEFNLHLMRRLRKLRERR